MTERNPAIPERITADILRLSNGDAVKLSSITAVRLIITEADDITGPEVREFRVCVDLHAPMIIVIEHETEEAAVIERRLVIAAWVAQ